MNWVEYNLNELGSFKNGLNFKKEKMGSGYPLINVKDITSNIRLNSKLLDLVDVSIKGKSASYLAERGDIFFVRSSVKREGVGMVGMLDDDEKTVHCGFVIRFRPNQKIIHPKFLLYLLSSPYWRESVRNLSGGTAIINISQGALKTLNVRFPESLQTQKYIADISSAYDDLIEKNLKRIKLLEQAAQNIYKEWFVNMRFPGYENTVINAATGIPEDWEVGVISDFGKVVTGKTPSTKRSDFYGGNIPFIKTPDMHGLPYVVETGNNLTELGEKTQLNKNLPANSVLVSCIGTAGVVAMTSKISQTNQQINSVVFDSTFKSYYFYCFAKKLKPLLEGLGSNGTTMVNVNKRKFENIDLNIPAESLLVNYSKIVEPMFKQILTLSIQNQKLEIARDILLPRLMNRTIEV